MGTDIKEKLRRGGGQSIMSHKIRVLSTSMVTDDTECHELKKPHAATADDDDDDDGEYDFPEADAVLSNAANNSTTPKAQDAASAAAVAAAGKAETVINSKISFPLNLTRMLESATAMGFDHIIHWSDDGLSFIICDIDSFLSQALPKFFKASENTKIRSFYRKLNRWGFSMSRKNANNPNNIWHHPNFNRSSAVKALNQAVETGKASDFLNMSSVSRGKKRRGTVGSDNTVQTIDSSNTSNTDHHSDVTLSRPRSRGGGQIRGGMTNISSISSMPSLPSAKPSREHKIKRWKQAHSFVLTQGGRSTSNTNNNVRPAMLSSQTYRQGYPNNSNDTFAPIGEGTSNATFDLSLLSSNYAAQNNPLMGMMSSSSNFGPSSNIFNLSAQEMMSARSSNNGLGRVPTPISSNTSMSYRLSSTERRQLLKQEMTPQEENELTDFLGIFAETLPPPGEDGEEGGEPDPLPDNM